MITGNKQMEKGVEEGESIPLPTIDTKGFPMFEEFDEYLKVKYPDEYEKFTQADKIFKYEIIFKLGFNQAKHYTSMRTEYDLLFGEKPLRKDMKRRIGQILWELQEVSSYPIVPPLRLSSAVKKIIGKDKRYVDQYVDWFLQYSNYQQHFNRVDLTYLSKVFPKSQIRRKEFW